MKTYQRLLTLIAGALLPVLVQAAGLADLIEHGDRQGALAAIDAGTDVNARQPDGSPPLLWAVHSVDHELVRELLKHGAKPDLRNTLGATPLTEAIDLADVDMAGMLLKAGADPEPGQRRRRDAADAGGAGGQSAPGAAAGRRRRQGQRARALPQPERIDVGGRGRSAAHRADPRVVDFLIASKAEVDVRAAANDWGNQITSEPRAQYRPTGGLTPLLYATVSGCLDCVKSLLKAGADINRPTPDGVTPLMNAIDNNHYDVANYLLDQGANPNLFDWWGRTARLPGRRHAHARRGARWSGRISQQRAACRRCSGAGRGIAIAAAVAGDGRRSQSRSSTCTGRSAAASPTT